MEYAVRQWQVNKNSVSVDYGPLTLSLKIEEEYKQMPSTETAVWDSKWQEGSGCLRMADIRDSACKPVELCLESPVTYHVATQKLAVGQQSFHSLFRPDGI